MSRPFSLVTVTKVTVTILKAQVAQALRACVMVM